MPLPRWALLNKAPSIFRVLDYAGRACMSGAANRCRNRYIWSTVQRDIETTPAVAWYVRSPLVRGWQNTVGSLIEMCLAQTHLPRASNVLVYAWEAEGHGFIEFDISSITEPSIQTFQAFHQCQSCAIPRFSPCFSPRFIPSDQV